MDPRARTLMVEATRAQESLKPMRALALLLRALEISPECCHLWMHRGFILKGLGKLAAAGVSFGNAMALDARNPLPRECLASVLYHLGRYQEAAKLAKSSLRLKQDAHIYSLLGCILSASHRPRAARTAWVKAIRLDPVCDEAIYNLASYYSLSRRPKTTMLLLRRAIRIDSGCAHYHRELGFVLMQLHRYEDSVRATQESLRLNPRLANAHTNLGVALEFLGRADEAEAEYALACKVDSDCVLPYLFRAKNLAARDRIPAADRCFRRALRAEPTNDRVLRAYGEFLIANGRPERGRVFLELHKRQSRPSRQGRPVFGRLHAAGNPSIHAAN